ncbi:MAG: citrate lyase subunit alpha, partial [Clostridia bacterium]|nr:citrate lyase subunit alpha [Clostridia bacterium]
MKNSLNRFVPDNCRPYISSGDYKKHARKLIAEKAISNSFERLSDYSDLFDKLQIKDGMTLSFHHHLRNGDFVFNKVCEEIKRRNLRNMKLAPSSIFPNNKILVELIENGNVTDIYTDYANGPVADAISEGKLKGEFLMHTHGGRPMVIESG